VVEFIAILYIDFYCFFQIQALYDDCASELVAVNGICYAEMESPSSQTNQVAVIVGSIVPLVIIIILGLAFFCYTRWKNKYYTFFDNFPAVVFLFIFYFLLNYQ